MVPLIFDIIAIVLIVIMIIVSAKKGFLSGLLSFAGWIISALVAKAFCGVVSNFLYSSLIKNKVYTTILAALEEQGASLSSSYSNFLESLPETIRSFLGSADSETLNSIFANSEIETVATRLCEDVVGPVILTMLTALAFIVIFLITLLIVKLFARLFKGVKKIPIIGPINTFLGGVAGAVEAIIIIYILKMVIEFSTAVAGGTLFGLTIDDFSGSYIFQFFNFRG